MTMRRILVKIHLWLGLAAALFLVILGLTGSVIAFEDDIVHWTHPGLFYVKTGAHTLPDQELIRIGPGELDRDRVIAVELRAGRAEQCRGAGIVGGARVVVELRPSRRGVARASLRPPRRDRAGRRRGRREPTRP